MKNLLFDLIASQPNSDGDFHGGGKYAKKIFFEFVKQKREFEWNIVGVYDSSKHLDSEIFKCADENNIALIDVKSSSLGKIVTKMNIQRFFTALPFSVIDYGLSELLESKCKVYVTIHGLRQLETAVSDDAFLYSTTYVQKVKFIAKNIFAKKMFRRDYLRFEQLLQRTNVVTVSNHTKYSILSFFPKIHSIKVFYSPDVTEFQSPNFGSGTVHFTMSNYFLMVSGNRWLKNNLRSAKALDEVFSERKDIKQNVIITGVNNPEVYLQLIKNKDRFIFYKYVDEDFLQILYKNAFSFVYMSLNEGFGYPPLEAMKYGVPVIASPFTAITEICDNAVLYCNPTSIQEIKSRILWLLYDQHKYDELSSNALIQFSTINKRQKEDVNGLIKYILE